MDEWISLLIISLIALICEYIDSALGGGYGTILTPVLLILGFDQLLVVPTILFTEFWTGLLSAIAHHKAGNANFSLKHVFVPETKKKHLLISEDVKISSLVALAGVFGGVIAAFSAISIPKLITKTYIGILVMIIGLLVLINNKWKFSWVKMGGIGLLAAFNKGISGGGYGPLVSSGQILIDRNPKQAVAATSMSEAVVCLSALLIYFFTGEYIFNFKFVLALLTGALGSIPFAVYTVKKISIKKFQPLIGIITICLGILTLLKTWIFISTPIKSLKILNGFI